MRIKKLKIENIRSYKEAELTFPEGSTLLSGDIGSGKTSILLAIEFALFGLQPGQRGSSLLRNDSDFAKVELVLDVDGKEVIIERTLKQGKSISQDYCSVSVDNEKYEASISEVKNKILKILSYPQEFAKKTNLLYKFTVYTPQEEMKQIILESKDTRLNTLRHVFGIDKYKRIEENTEFLTSKLRAKIREEEIKILPLSAKKISLKEKSEGILNQKSLLEEKELDLIRIIEERKNKESQIEDVDKQIQEKKMLETEKAKSEVMLSSKTSSMENLRKNLLLLEEQIYEASKKTFSQTEFDNSKQRLKEQEEKLKLFNEKYISILSKINTQNSRKQEAEGLIEKISKMRVCPTCLQNVDDAYKENIFSKINQEVKSLSSEIETFEQNKKELIQELEKIKQNTELINSVISELEVLKLKSENIKEKQNTLLELKKQQESENKDREMISSHIFSLEKSIMGYSRFEKEYELKTKELKEIQVKENTLQINKAEINKEIQFLEKELNQLTKEIAELEEIKSSSDYTKELEYWLSNKFLPMILYTEKKVMLNLREKFSKLFSDWFSTLVSETLSVRLDENFSPIVQQQDYEIEYDYLSGGERTAVALAYRLALNQTINSIMSKIKTKDLVILDEPTDGFSEQQLDKMRDVLSQLNVKQLILVSHESKIESFVENIIKFKKENNITSIEQP